MRLLQNRFTGWMILIVGIIILLSMTDNHFTSSLVLFLIGILLLRKHYRKAGYSFLTVSVLLLLDQILRFDWVWTLVSLLLIYWGYRMFRGDSKRPVQNKKPGEREACSKLRGDQQPNTGIPLTEERNIQFQTPLVKSSAVGRVYLIDRRFELTDLNMSYGICDVKINLSKAIIPEGESTIVISGLIGNVDIYIPDDLDVSIAATVMAGYLDVPGAKQGGVNRQAQLATTGYEQARRRVKISVSMLFGDIGVRHL
ncbi:cell wall-active antibiotics response protein LiaF [Lihuaxuella thermophila]|uniref:Lia operon protein LiaF n=1 Tax=Lihuaxuella thermophila TaxID=1173111 RepID=A0A1H8BR64_9BACL|nr:cell wall-active antibiotics response protein LiaF [Lihuaxuella thermophila]SEM85049.1 lia operon protein LiaF [Lihuaxuella thermophila]